MFSDRIFFEIEAVWPYFWNVPGNSQISYTFEAYSVPQLSLYM